MAESDEWQDSGMPAGKVLYLSRHDVQAVELSMAECIALVEQALVEHGEKRVQMPPTSGVSPGGGAFLHAMPAYLPRLGAMGIKWVSIAPHTLPKSMRRINGLVILNHPETTLPVCMMDCAWITAMRTAAVTAVAARFLARPGASTLAIIGAGVQGRTNLLSIQEVLPDLQEARIYDVDPDALERYCREMEGSARVTVTPVGHPRNAADGADLIVTATPVQPQPRPLVQDEWLKPGGLALPLEIDSAWPRSTIEGVDKFICDDWRQLQHVAGGGFPIHFFAAGLPPVYAELGEIVSGRKQGRESRDERIMSLNLGMGIMDVIVGHRIYHLALERGLGKQLDLD